MLQFPRARSRRRITAFPQLKRRRKGAESPRSDDVGPRGRGENDYAARSYYVTFLNTRDADSAYHIEYNDLLIIQRANSASPEERDEMRDETGADLRSQISV